MYEGSRKPTTVGEFHHRHERCLLTFHVYWLPFQLGLNVTCVRIMTVPDKMLVWWRKSNLECPRERLGAKMKIKNTRGNVTVLQYLHMTLVSTQHYILVEQHECDETEAVRCFQVCFISGGSSRRRVATESKVGRPSLGATGVPSACTPTHPLKHAEHTHTRSFPFFI